MYANVRRHTFKPGKVIEGARQIEQEVVPIISKIPGFLSFYVVHSGEDTITVMGVFETREAAEKAGPQAIAWVNEHLAAIVAGPEEVTNGPVLVHHGK